METTGRIGVSGVPSSTRELIRAEAQADEVVREAIYAEIMQLLPVDVEHLTRVDLLTILRLCNNLDALHFWPGWAHAVRRMAFVVYLNDSGVRSLLPVGVGRLYEREPDEWDQE